MQSRGVLPVSEWRRLTADTTGLKGRRLRVLTDLPTNDAAVPQDQLPQGITDVIADEDEVTVLNTVRVHPVGDPHTIAYVRYDQLAVNDRRP